MKKLIAFTLAEVLIVLGIIGVVAEMTIPGLVNETQKVQFTTGYKKAYTTWAQALSQMAMDTGCTGDLSCFFDSNDLATMGDKITKYFKIAKNCKITTNQNCWLKSAAYQYDGRERYSSFVNEDSTYYKFQTLDGMSYAIAPNIFANCNSETNYTSLDNNLSRVCIDTFLVDVNGPKAPNIWGRDIFGFYITSGKAPTLYPWGGEDELDYGNYWKENGYCQATNKDSANCGARIIEEGWQMNY